MKNLALLLFILCSFTLSGQKKVLLEKITSANCGSCPNASIDIKALTDTYPNVIWINHHWWTDQMGNPSSTEIITGMNGSGTPQGMIDRVSTGNSPIYGVGNFESKILARLDEPAYGELQISAAVDTINGLLEATVKVNFSEHPPEGDIRLSLIILEDDMTGSGYGWNQSNYFNEVDGHPLYGLGQPIRGYEHQNVVRKIFDDAWGVDDVIPDDLELNTDYAYSVSWEMDELIQNPANIELVAAINIYNEDHREHKVLNAAYLDVSDMDFFVSSEEVTLNDKFEIFPNPAGNYVNLLLPSGKFEIELFNFQGMLQKSWNDKVETINLDLQELNSGIYMLVFSDQKGLRYSKKLIIQK